MSKRGVILVRLLFLALSLNGCSHRNASDSPAARATLGGISEKNFARLVSLYLRGRTTMMPWAGYWWPFTTDGISDAAVKYENARGSTGASDWEMKHHGVSAPGLQSWFGHCNGWAAASALFPEPQSSRDISGVTFSIADQKALLTEIGMEVSADYFGHRANTNDPEDPAFQDIFPDQFFLVLTNYTGKGLPAVMDRYTGDQVWNQPIAGYQFEPVKASDYLGADPSAPGVYRMVMTVQLWWVRDDVSPGQVTEAFNFADGPSYSSRTLGMEIWFDAPAVFSGDTLLSSGDVILSPYAETVGGGVWNLGGLDPADSHPDYIWIPHAVTPPTVYSNPMIEAAWVKQMGTLTEF